MDKSNNVFDTWDWDVGKKEVADVNKWQEKFQMIQEPCISQDGQNIAAIVRNEDLEYCVCYQNSSKEIKSWEDTFDKIWNLKYGSDNRLTAIVSEFSEWTVVTDGVSWENKFDFVWNLLSSNDGSKICANAAASVLTVALKEGEIEKFQKGCYTVAVNGKPWNIKFVNV